MKKDIHTWTWARKLVSNEHLKKWVNLFCGCTSSFLFSKCLYGGIWFSIFSIISNLTVWFLCSDILQCTKIQNLFAYLAILVIESWLKFEATLILKKLLTFLCTPAESWFNEIDEIFIVFPKMEKNQKKSKRFKYLCSHMRHLFPFFGFSMVLYTNTPKPRVTGVHPWFSGNRQFTQRDLSHWWQLNASHSILSPQYSQGI